MRGARHVQQPVRALDIIFPLKIVIYYMRAKTISIPRFIGNPVIGLGIHIFNMIQHDLGKGNR